MGSIARSPNPENRLLNPDTGAPSFSADAPASLQDAAIRIVMIPLFGVVVPHMTGYFGPIEPDDPRYWFGLLWGCLISFLIWHGNRYFLIKQRQHYDWFQHPVRKLTALIFTSIFYTSSCTVLLMFGWFRFASLEIDWVVIRSVTLASVVCVLFITHVYETVFLIQQRESDLIAVERLERARTEAELEALKIQVAPHFLFNSLNTLGWLINNSREKALEFNQNLADVYRYILLARRRELVPIDNEVHFVQQYFSLLEIRFANSLGMQIPDAPPNWYVPPISLQAVVENAVKHNEHSADYPLAIRVSFEGDAVQVVNRKRARMSPPHVAGVGLQNLDERCRLVLGRGIEVRDSPGEFVVRIPVRVV